MSEAPSLFSPESGKRSQGELIPKGTLAWVGITIQEMRQSKETGGQYASIELTIIGDNNPFAGRKVFEMICDPYDQRNSEAWRVMGVAALTRIFESAGVFDPARPETYNKYNGQTFLTICGELDGLVGAAKIGVDPGKDGHSDKNRVQDWLSPNPVSKSEKDFMKLANPQQAAETARAGFLGSAQTAGVAQTAGAAMAAPNEVQQPVSVSAPVATGAPSFQKPGAAGSAGATARPAWLQPKPAGQ